jgi:type VI secretion system secreted protein Hcp
MPPCGPALIPMKLPTLLIALALLAVAPLAAQRIYIAPTNAGGGALPAGANFGGESTDSRYPGWAELENAAFSFESLGAGAAARVGRVTAGPFVIIKRLDGSSQFFLTNCLAGRTIPLLTVEYVKPVGGTGFTYQIITLKDVRVAAFKQNAPGGDKLPMEEMTLLYSSIELTYLRPDAAGRPIRGRTYGWNFGSNTAIPSP